MKGTLGIMLSWAVFLSKVKVVSAAEDSVGIIVAGAVAGVLLLLVFIGVTIFCFYKRRGPFAEKRKGGHKNHQVFVANGYLPPHQHYVANGYLSPHQQHYVKRNHHKSNGHSESLPPAAVVKPLPPPLPAFVEPVRYPPVTVPYATYHGPPPELLHQSQQHARAGTMSGPPPILIPFETTGGTMTIRADPRPVVHKSKYRKRDTSRDVKDDRKRSPSKHRSPDRRRSRPPSQEFVVQQSYDGIPVIRPVIYVDDDEDDRRRHRSKSRDRHHKKHSSSSKEDVKITEITVEKEPRQGYQESPELQRSRSGDAIDHLQTTTDKSHQQPQTHSRPRTPVVQDRSRASSVTEAVNALRMSVQDHVDDDSDSSSSHSSSKAPSFRWAHTEHQRAPEPKAGDVIFFAAGVEVETERNQEPHAKQKDDNVYSYSKVIKRSTKERAPSPERRESPVTAPPPVENEGYEVPKDLRRSTAGTREEEKSYQTEHDRVTSGQYSHIGVSMSDRLQHLVEDGDKSRVTHYNIGAIDFGDEEPDAEKIEMRVRRPDTPPVDIPGDSFYSKVHRRPKTPPNDIPLTSRDSAEVPRLNLGSSMYSPRDVNSSYRPSTPPKDFPITPQSSFIKPRPKTPPTDFPMTPTEDVNRPRTPPYDAPDTSRSAAVDPSTGEPGSFQARRRLIEAHLMKNVQSAPSKAPTAQTPPPKPAHTPAPPPAPSAPIVHVTPGVIPPPPPPPPLPVARPKITK